MSQGAAVPTRARGGPRGRAARALLLIGTVVVLVTSAAVAWLVLVPQDTACHLVGDPGIVMAFTTVIDRDWNASVKITFSGICEPASYYRFILSVGSARSALQPLASAGTAVVVVNGTTFHVSWIDATGDGLVNTRDSFRVTGDGAHLPAPPGPAEDFRYGLEFHGPDGAWLALARWDMPFLPPAPSVTFGVPIPSGGDMAIPVSAVSTPYEPRYFWLNLAVGSVAGTPCFMPQVSGPPGSREFVGEDQYNLSWIDADGSGTVSAGDQFLVTGNGAPLPASTEFRFMLLWTDESPMASVSWTT